MVDIQAQLAALRAAFLTQLGARVAELEAAWASGDLAEVHRQAHKLAGTAGTFGVADVSALARELEFLLSQAREGALVPESDRATASALLRQLREAALP